MSVMIINIVLAFIVIVLAMLSLVLLERKINKKKASAIQLPKQDQISKDTKLKDNQALI